MENASKALIIAGAILIAILLITIGIILINSGRDITDTGVAGMQSQKIQTFNSQFTPYEGKKKGSELRSLFNTVNASNATDSEHQVTVYRTGDAKVNDTETTSTLTRANIPATRTYKVTVHYAESSTAGTPTGTIQALEPTTVTSPPTEAGYIDYILIDTANPTPANGD